MKDGASIAYEIREKEAGYFNTKPTVWSKPFIVCDKDPTIAKGFPLTAATIYRPVELLLQDRLKSYSFGFSVILPAHQDGSTSIVEMYKKGRSFEVKTEKFSNINARYTKDF